jgi:hypothetical protein
MPSKAISPGYEPYVIETQSCSTIAGVIGAQTPTSVAIRHEGGKEDVIQRKEIKRMYTANLSAMADLLEYLKTAH